MLGKSSEEEGPGGKKCKRKRFSSFFSLRTLYSETFDSAKFASSVRFCALAGVVEKTCVAARSICGRPRTPRRASTTTSPRAIDAVSGTLTWGSRVEETRDGGRCRERRTRGRQELEDVE